MVLLQRRADVAACCASAGFEAVKTSSAVIAAQSRVSKLRAREAAARTALCEANDEVSAHTQVSFYRSNQDCLGVVIFRFILRLRCVRSFDTGVVYCAPIRPKK